MKLPGTARFQRDRVLPLTSQEREEKARRLKARIAQCRRYQDGIAKNVATIMDAGLEPGAEAAKLKAYLGDKTAEEWEMLYTALIREAKDELSALEQKKDSKESNDERKGILLAGAAVVGLILLLTVFLFPMPIAVLTGNVIGGASATPLDTLIHEAQQTGGTFRITTTHGLFETPEQEALPPSEKVSVGERKGTLEVVVSPKGVLSAYETPVELVSERSTPRHRHATYRIKNEKGIETGYLAVTPGTHLSVIDEQKRAVSLVPLGTTSDFVDEWKMPDTVLGRIRQLLDDAGVETRPDRAFPTSLLPAKGELLVLYAYDHPFDSWAIITTDGPPTGKLLFLDPAAAWWDYNWDYRCNVTLSETQGLDRTNEPVELMMDELAGNCPELIGALENSVRVFDNETEIASQLDDWNASGTGINDSGWLLDGNDELIFLANVSANTSKTFWVYFDYQENASPSYASDMNASFNAGNVNINNTYYRVSLDNSGVIDDIRSRLGNEVDVTEDWYWNYFRTVDNWDVQDFGAGNWVYRFCGPVRCSIKMDGITGFIDTSAADTRYNLYARSPEIRSYKRWTMSANEGMQIGDDLNVNGGYTFNATGSHPSWIETDVMDGNGAQERTDRSGAYAFDTGWWAYRVVGANTDAYAVVRKYVIDVSDNSSHTMQVNWYDASEHAAGWESGYAGSSDFLNGQTYEIANFYFAANASDADYSYAQDWYNKTVYALNLTIGGSEELGILNATMDEPWNSTRKYRSEVFTMNGTVWCPYGTCGNVSAYSQYYSTVSPLKTWTETTQADFSSFNESVNITILQAGTLKLATTTSDIWFDSDWPIRKPINLSEQNGTSLTDFQVNITLDTASLIAAGKMESDCADLRFADGNGTALSFWIEKGCNTSATTVWVKTSLAANENATIYAYYGNPGASSASSIDDVMETGLLVEYWNDTGAVGTFNTLTGTCTDTGLNYNWGTGTVAISDCPNNLANYVTLRWTGWLIPGGNGTHDFFTTHDDGARFYVPDTNLIINSWIDTGPIESTGSYSFNTTQTIRWEWYENGGGAVAQLGWTPPGGSKVYPIPSSNLRSRRYVAQPPLIAAGSEENLSYRSVATYASSPYDTGSSGNSFEDIWWSATTPSNTTMGVYVRSSPDNATWSAWLQEINGTQVDSPSNRYVQYLVNMTTTNATRTPEFRELNLHYRFVTQDWKDMGLGGAFVTSNPYGCGNLSAASANCTPDWSVTPQQLGTYAVRIYANTTKDQALTVMTVNSTIDIYARSYLLELLATPSTEARGEPVTFRARLLDDQSQPLAGRLLNFTDQTEALALGTNVTDAQGYAFFTVMLNDSFALGDHILNVSFLTNDSDFIEGDSETISYRVSSTPNVGQENALPGMVGIRDPVTISANVTDNVGVDAVWVNVTYPDSGWKRFDMTGPGGNGTYTLVFTDTWQVGSYVFKISANNTDGIIMDPPGNFTVNATAAMYVDAERDEYKNFETVHLSEMRRSDWWNVSWLYRKDILVQGVNDSLSEYQVPLSLDTQALVAAGKLNANCSDLRFVASKQTYELPVTITNTLGRTIMDEAVKIVITDADAVSHMSASGNDLRVFATPPIDPYATPSDTPFWFAGVSGSKATVWVRIASLADGQNKTFHLYYGHADATTESNYSAIFTTPIGIAEKTSASGSWNATTFSGISFNSTPVVVGSLTTINDAAQAALRLANVTTGNFSAKAEESITLDGVHTAEGIGYLALKPGTWVLGGKVIQVNTTTMDNPTGTSYNTVGYGYAFSSTPEVIAQVQTFNDTDPVHTRMQNAGLTSIDIKLEETASGDTSHGYEDIGFLALEAGIYETGNGTLQVGNLATTNTPASIPYSSTIADPVLSAKIETEAGGDNSHERINAGGSGATVFVEEEAAYDGAHTTETLSWIASDSGILYGAPYGAGPSVSAGTESVFSSNDVLLDHYLDGGCNTTNTSLLVQVPFIPASSTTSIHVYYGNPAASSSSNLTATMTYDAPQTIGYVVSGNLVNNGFDVFSLDDGNAVVVGTVSTDLDKGSSVNVPSSAITMGTAIQAKSLIQADSSSQGTDIISPSTWAGTEFIYFWNRGTDDFYLLSPWGTANVTMYDGSSVSYAGTVDENGLFLNNYDIGNSNVMRIVSDIPILVQHTTGTGDSVPLYPAQTVPVYGVPGGNLYMGAGPNGATVQRNYSNSGSLADAVLGVNGTYSQSGGGADGSAPAYRLATNSSSNPIGAIQQADGDGGESTTFLPANQLAYRFGSSRAAAHIAIAAPTLGTNCTLYNGSGAVVASALSSGNSLISKIGFGTGNDAQVVGADWIVECDYPVWAQFDDLVKQDETHLMGIQDMRQYYYPEPAAAAVNGTEEQAYTGLQNNGETNVTGYLYMSVQKNSTGTWQITGVPVYQDVTERVVNPGSVLNISSLWDASGAWSTSTRSPGWYRVYAAFRDNESNILNDSRGVSLVDWGLFRIVQAQLQLNNLTHENEYESGINEYEAGDIVDWVNVTIQAKNNTAISASINLTLLNGTGSYAGWGPASSQSCGNIAENETCTLQWNNSGAGYGVPLNVPSGSYIFTWRVNMTSTNGPSEENNSFTLVIHNTPSTFASTLSPTRIFTNGTGATYTFNVTNLWSANLTGVTARLNIPQGIGLSATCIGGGTPTGDGACTLAQFGNGTQASFSFDISANSSAAQGDYWINLTLNYTNPGGELRTWTEQEPSLLEVRQEGIIAITVVSSPATVTRGSTAVISAFVNNTGVDPAANVTVNYTFPGYGWNNQTPLDAFFPSLASYAIEWHNLTFTPNISAAPGQRQVLLESGSATGQNDFKYIDIIVYANTTTNNVSVNDTNASRGEYVTLSATLRYDNGTSISGATVSFQDLTDTITIGNAVTNSQGVATRSWLIPDTASLGLHTLNASYAGSGSLYTKLSWNTTLLDIGLKPNITTALADPDPQGQGSNVTLSANITDDDTLDSVLVTVVAPNGTTLVDMQQMVFSAGLYSYLFNQTWHNGTYSFTIWANDSTGSASQKAGTFLIENQAFLWINVTPTTYGQNEDVTLQGHSAGWWWDGDWRYRINYSITELDGLNLSDVQVNLTIDTASLVSAGKLQADCSDLRFISVVTGASLEYWRASPCNTSATAIWLKLPVLNASQTFALSMYYGNPSTSAGTNTSPGDVFSGSQVVVSDSLATGNLNLSGFYNDTTVCIDGGSCRVINRSDIITVNSSSLATNTTISATKPVGSGFHLTGVGSPLTPLAWLGKNFTFPGIRGTQSLDIYSPYQVANVTLYDSGGARGAVVIQPGQTGEINYNPADGTGLRLVSNASVIVHYEDETGNNDYLPLYPESNGLYGVESGSTNGAYREIVCGHDNMNVTVYYDNGTTRNYPNCNQFDTIEMGGGTGGGAGATSYVVSNVSALGGIIAADGDGTEAIQYLPMEAVDRYYVLPQPAEYISLVARDPSTACELRNPSGSLLDSATSTSYAPPRPQSVIRFTGTPIPAGSRVTCDSDVWAYYEYYDQNTETTLLGAKSWRNRGATLPSVSEGSEATYGSVLANTGNTTLRGSLLLLVQRNVSGSWEYYATVRDDVANGTMQELPVGGYLNLGALWNASPWNTGNAPAGQYRAYAALAAPDGHVLSSISGPLWDVSGFTITPPALVLNITAITIYDVTQSLNKHVYSANLSANSTNDTFLLLSGHDYRIELHVLNQGNSSIWNLSPVSLTHAGLNASWIIDAAADIWYRNASDASDRLGGSWNGTVWWNTSANGGLVKNATAAVFSYVINLTGAASGDFPVTFLIDDPSLQVQDNSVFRIVQTDSEPPVLYNDSGFLVYNITLTSIFRGGNTTIYARWNESISNATVAYNSTSSLIQNYSVTLPSPNPRNWTNHTIVTSVLWNLGRHVAKLYAADEQDNWNKSLKYFNFTIWGLARVSSSSITKTVLNLSDSTTLTCRVRDATNNAYIDGYVVRFYNGTSFLGSNLTNSTGHARFTYQDFSAGNENFTCNITMNATRYYQIDSQNEASYELTTLEPELPYADSVSANVTVAHKGDTVGLRALWHDNFQLDTATLATNATGGWQNVSALALSGTDDWANFSYVIPNNFTPGYLGWRQYGNDTSGNVNVTPDQSLEVWGWAIVESILLEPAFIYTTNTTNITCRVVDEQNGSGIAGYNVSFYNSTGYLGWNTTNASGHARFYYTDYSAGIETMRCQIGDEAGLLYNDTSPNNKSASLTTGQGGDIQPPYIISGRYGLNDTVVKKGESLRIFGQWSEYLNRSTVRYNSTSATINGYSVSPPFTHNWTNYTITTAASWLVGGHVAKLEATDLSNNTNATAAYLQFNVTATSQISWTGPSGTFKPGNLTPTCRVTEQENGQPIAGYTVYFYNDTGGLIGTPSTDAAGYANVTVNTSGYDGYYDFSCRIFSAPSKFYYIGSGFQDSKNLLFDPGKPGITLVAPANKTVTMNTTLNLSFVSTDDYDSLLDCNLTVDGSTIWSGTATAGVQRDVEHSFGYGRHDWNVTCWDDADNVNTSFTRWFNISSLDVIAPVVLLTGPVDNSYLNSSTVELSYNATDLGGLQSCSLYIDGVLNDTDSSPVAGGDTFNLTGVADAPYDWYVTCTDPSANQGQSENRSFTVDTIPPGAFNLVSPPNRTVTGNLTPRMVWQSSADTNFWNYTLQVSLSSVFLTGVTTRYIIFNQSLTNKTLLPLQMNRVYFWRVVAGDRAGWETVSQVWQYITDDQPPTVLLISPPDGDNDPDGNVTLVYQANDYNISNCTLYTNLTGSWAPYANDTSIPVWSHQNFSLSGLAQNTTFHWNVRCVDSLGYSAAAVANWSVRIGAFNETQGNETIPINASVNNTVPYSVGVSVQGPVDLIANGQQRINCTANVTDDNGAADILGADAVLYHSSVSLSSPDNESNHYTNASCGTCTVLNSTTASCGCTFALDYWALPGAWTCSVRGIDAGGNGTYASGATTVNQLQAVDVSPTLLDYGNIEGGIPSPEENVSVINLGNVPIDVDLWGYAVTQGDDLAMSCVNGANITVSAERFSTSQGATYGAMTPLAGTLPTAPTALLSIPVRSGASNSSLPLYWRIQSGSGVLGECNGTIVFHAEIA